MTVYADYTFYSGEYLSGKAAVIADESFPFYAREASRIIDTYTYGNIVPYDIPDEVKLCCCELAESVYKAENSEAQKKQGIASESVTGWSQSYESSESREKAAHSAHRQIVYKWLSGTGLLFAGVR